MLVLVALSSALPGFSQTFLAEWTASTNGGVGPTGMALATEGTVNYLYVSDHPRGRIVKFNLATGAIAAVFGQQGSGPGQFSQPYGIAIEGTTGDLYVADRGNNRVQRITNTGAFVMSWGTLGTAQGQFNEPVGVAIDAEGNIYVTEHTNHRVQKFRVTQVTQSGTSWAAANVAMWGSQGTGNGQFNIPYGILADAAGILVADGFNSRVQRFNTSGVFQSSFGASGSGPGQFVVVTGITADSTGALYVTSTNSDPQNGALPDSNNQWISKFSSTGTFISRWGGAYGSGPGQFRLPFSTVIGPNNRAYVADYYNNRVQIFDLAGTATPPPPPPPASGAPTVSSFTVGATTATSVTFNITFSSPVTGVNSTDFTAVTAGGATATIGTVAGSGAAYAIPVSFTGTGTIRLSLNATGTGIADASGNAYTAGAAGPTYTIGTVPPPPPPPPPSGTGTKVISITPPANGTYESGQSLIFTVRFSGNVTVVGGNDDDDDEGDKKGDDDDDDDDDAERPFFTWTAVPAAGAQGSGRKVSYISGSGTSALTFRYKVKSHDVAPAGITLGTTLQLPDGAMINDASNKPIAAAGLTLPWAANPLRGVILDGGKSKGGSSGIGNTGNGNKGTQVIVLKPVPGAAVGDSITLTATSSSGLPVTFVLVSGNATLVGNVLTPKNKGAIVIRVVQGGSVAFAATSMELTLDAKEKRNDRLVNLSSRLRLNGDDPNRSVIAGFVVTGASTKQVLIRAVGPGLVGFGIRDALGTPRLHLRDRDGKTIAENDGWKNNADISAAGDRVGAFKLASGSRDAALYLALPPGAYTAQVASSGSGITLLEVYDANGAQFSAEQLVNISTRGYVESGEGQLVAGFVISGETPKRVLIRGIGPSLSAFGVAGTVADPAFKLFASGRDVPIAQNDDWETPQSSAATVTATAADIVAAAAATGAFPLGRGTKDAALVVTLAPGSYSAVMNGANNGTGAGLIEVYEIPNP